MDARITQCLPCLALFLLLAGCFAEDVTYASAFYSKGPLKLSKFSSFSSARLHHFRVPEDTVLVRWLLTVTRGSGLNCGTQNVTVHFRAGAPPVIDPVGTAFPNQTAVTLAWNLTLSVGARQQQNQTLVNVSSPACGDWFVAAHLPEDDGKIQQKGLPSCFYLFQPQMLIRRAVDTPTLLPNIPLSQTLSSAHTPSILKFFVPEFSTQLAVTIVTCAVEGVARPTCGLGLLIGSASSGRDSRLTYNCSGEGPCTASVSAPPWGTWVQVAVETSLANVTMTFNISANSTVACKPKSAPADFNSNFTVSVSNGTTAPNVSTETSAVARGDSSAGSCILTPAVSREDTDVLSLRFTVADGNLTVPSDPPTLVTFDLNSAATSGGTLNVQISLNRSSVIGGFTSVRACLTPSVPVMALNNSQSCATAFVQGYSLSVDSSVTETALRIPFPEASMWYLTLQTLCNNSECSNVSAVVGVSVNVSACIDDCGAYGDCRLLRTHSYLYASCACKAGWRGWGCTDGSKALSFSLQLRSVLFLTLSNLLFLPPIILALYRGYLPEAAVYLYNMFFSTFYHACDQPGVTVLCILDYDTLQFCDFLGSCTSVWVTVICMAKLQDLFKYVLFMSGALLIAMAMSLDRHGLWNFLGPLLFALITMVSAWVYRGVGRRQCYPPLWRRWVFYLLPGIALALIGVCVYVFAETDGNYLYTHSLWHVLIATSILFLLPPRDTHTQPWGWTHSLCGYKICKNQKEDLYTVS
ncbi:post-GPI attachment to proteins factor 6 isoform X3 [Clupea harengus]|uniref:Post-GPI attachment to proteins factor 6 isoform X3 n=1 Tax=Clupea harengus TaxID=7950 RepID=A0A6P8F3W1_CLUHA|nr:post-GPI attachment to proteins factor 6 isoform X3 [Clupea harengus]